MADSSNLHDVVDTDRNKTTAVHQEDAYDEKTASVFAQAADPDEGKSIWRIIKENPKVIGYAIVANAGPLLFGYDILVTGACVALPAFS